jgi:SLOG in TRPM, prokaryote
MFETPDVMPVGSRARAVRVAMPADVPPALDALGLGSPRPVIVLVGGAGALSDSAFARLRPLFDEALLPVAGRLHATVVDGGTRSGVMRALGESRARSGEAVVLVGVAVARTVRLDDGTPPVPDAADLDPHHTHFVLVPGTHWGDESPWLARVARTLSGSLPSVTVLVNGGEVAVDDAVESMTAERPLIVIDGSGRAADDLAAALGSPSLDERLSAVAASGLVTVVALDRPAALAAALTSALSS